MLCCSLLAAHSSHFDALQTYGSRHTSVFMTYRCRARWRQHSETPPSQQSNISRGRAPPLPPASLPTICVSTLRTWEARGERRLFAGGLCLRLWIGQRPDHRRAESWTGSWTGSALAWLAPVPKHGALSLAHGSWKKQKHRRLLCAAGSGQSRTFLAVGRRLRVNGRWMGALFSGRANMAKQCSARQHGQYGRAQF